MAGHASVLATYVLLYTSTRGLLGDWFEVYSCICRLARPTGERGAGLPAGSGVEVSRRQSRTLDSVGLVYLVRSL